MEKTLIDNSGLVALTINEFNIGVRNWVIDKFIDVGIKIDKATR